MSEKLAAETYTGLKDEVKETVSKAAGDDVYTDHDRRFTATFNGQNSGVITEYSKATTDDASVFTERQTMPRFNNEEVSSQLQASVDAESGNYATKVSDKTGLFEGDNRVASTTVSRVENGETVTRSIKNPKAAELVTRLAMKKINTAESQENKKAA